jgi:hypothetical protein
MRSVRRAAFKEPPQLRARRDLEIRILSQELVDPANPIGWHCDSKGGTADNWQIKEGMVKDPIV